MEINNYKIDLNDVYQNYKHPQSEPQTIEIQETRHRELTNPHKETKTNLIHNKYSLKYIPLVPQFWYNDIIPQWKPEKLQPKVHLGVKAPLDYIWHDLIPMDEWDSYKWNEDRLRVFISLGPEHWEDSFRYAARFMSQEDYYPDRDITEDEAITELVYYRCKPIHHKSFSELEDNENKALNIYERKFTFINEESLYKGQRYKVMEEYESYRKRGGKKYFHEFEDDWVSKDLPKSDDKLITALNLQTKLRRKAYLRE